MLLLRIDERSPYQQLVGVGGLGTGIFFALEGDHTLGRNESRAGRLLDVRDYCKLHIVTHYVAKLLKGSRGSCFQILPVGKIGDDAAGRSVLEEMKAVGMDTRFVGLVPAHPTLFSVCFQYPDGTGGNITTSNSAAVELSPDDVDEAAESLRSGGRQTIALALPEISLKGRQRLLEVATEAKAFRAASFVSGEIASAREGGMFSNIDLVSLNESEAAEFVGEEFTPADPEGFVGRCLEVLCKSYPKLHMVITAGKSGAYAVGNGTWNYCPAPEVQVASTAGAGDCLLGGILAALAAGIPLLESRSARTTLGERPLDTALEFGVMLASYKVTSGHTIHPDACLASLIEFAHQRGVSFGPNIQQLFVQEVVESGC
jgi:sugar/nucleoside kinase (ribokinase family)